MNRQQRANENWREKFEALGLSNGFVFVSRDWSSEHGHKAAVECEKCGTVFATWGLHEIYKGRQSRLICPECGASSDGADVWLRSARCDEAMAYYVQGHTVIETAKRFNTTVAQVNNAVKIRGLTNGKDWREAGAEACAKRSEEAAILFAQKVASGERRIPRGGNRHMRRAVMYGCEYDSKVTLKKLIKRDGLRCALCGEMCDPNDNTWAGHFGPKRPTIDHIIPMSKGGGHVWGNVQVAHAICNSIKRDKVEEAAR